MTNLPVPVPASEVPGNFITGALWNANVFNGLTYLLNPPVFLGYQGVVQSIANSSWVTVALDSTSFDTYGGHSNSTNNSRYTAQVAGYHQLSGIVSFAASSSGFRAARFAVNGGAVVAGTAYAIANGVFPTIMPTVTRDIYLNVGDYVELNAWQNSGGALAIGNTSGDVTTAMNVRWTHA